MYKKRYLVRKIAEQEAAKEIKIFESQDYQSGVDPRDSIPEPKSQLDDEWLR